MSKDSVRIVFLVYSPKSLLGLFFVFFWFLDTRPKTRLLKSWLFCVYFLCFDISIYCNFFITFIKVLVTIRAPCSISEFKLFFFTNNHWFINIHFSMISDLILHNSSLNLSIQSSPLYR